MGPTTKLAHPAYGEIWFSRIAAKSYQETEASWGLPTSMQTSVPRQTGTEDKAEARWCPSPRTNLRSCMSGSKLVHNARGIQQTGTVSPLERYSPGVPSTHIQLLSQLTQSSFVHTYTNLTLLPTNLALWGAPPGYACNLF